MQHSCIKILIKLAWRKKKYDIENDSQYIKEEVLFLYLRKK